MKLPKLLTGILLLGTFFFTLSSCSDDDGAKPVPREQSYKVTAYGSNEISGTANFKEVLNTDSVQVTIKLQGKDINNLSALPVKIRQGTSIESGEVLFDLGSYNGAEKELVKTIKLSYDDLVKLNASIGVYNPNNSDILAQAEIGSNSTYESYTMTNPTTNEMNGQFRIYKREKGSYVVIHIGLEGLATACEGVDHPAKVLDADGIPDTDIVLNPVADSNGVSATHLSEQAYEDLTKYNGSINVYCSESLLVKTISQGNF